MTTLLRHSLTPYTSVLIPKLAAVIASDTTSQRVPSHAAIAGDAPTNLPPTLPPTSLSSLASSLPRSVYPSLPALSSSLSPLPGLPYPPSAALPPSHSTSLPPTALSQCRFLTSSSLPLTPLYPNLTSSSPTPPSSQQLWRVSAPAWRPIPASSSPKSSGFSPSLNYPPEINSPPYERYRGYLRGLVYSA